MMDDDIDGDSDDDDQNDNHDIILEQWLLKRYFSMYLNKCSIINKRAIYLSRGILLSIRHDFDFICITSSVT